MMCRPARSAAIVSKAISEAQQEYEDQEMPMPPKQPFKRRYVLDPFLKTVRGFYIKLINMNHNFISKVSKENNNAFLYFPLFILTD